MHAFLNVKKQCAIAEFLKYSNLASQKIERLSYYPDPNSRGFHTIPYMKLYDQNDSKRFHTRNHDIHASHVLLCMKPCLDAWTHMVFSYGII